MKFLVKFFGYLFGIGAAFGLVVAAGVWMYLQHMSEGLPDYTALKNYEPPVMTRVHASDGTLMAEGGRAMSGVKLELLDPSGRVIATTISEFDGFFLFEKVPYGQYRLRIGAESAAALDLEQQLDTPARVGRDTPTASLGIVAARRQSREEVVISAD